MIEIKQLVIFLNKIHLFNGLKEEDLADIAVKLQEREYSAGSVIFQRGDKPDGLYFIYKGRVKVAIPKPHEPEGEKFLAWLNAGDYFGEEALFENRNRSAQVTASEHCTLLFMAYDSFFQLLSSYPKLKPNFQVAIKSRKLARSTNFKWLGPKEVIYFIARRHKIRLYQALLAPVASLLVPVGLLSWGLLTGATTPLALSIVLFVGIFGWAVWNAIDWSNDYYIVTNQRVIWLEKVIGLHDSREEAPLGTILSVGVETDMIGRALDFGNVIVRTFVGKIEFDHVDHPAQAADMIREYWERVKSVTNISQQEIMRNTIRQKLGLPVDKKKLDDLPPVVVEDKNIAQKPLWMLAIADLFRLRVEDGGTIIYHKHWIVLLQQAWRPLAGTLGVLFLMLWRMWYLAVSPERSFLQPNSLGALRPDTIMVTLPLVMLPFLGWLIWEYLDWKNDIFMVTQDEIFDVDRKPFGKEERRAAQIENILSTSYKRNGFIAYMFNYGTVNIVVGGTNMDFQDVMDPAAVQADINRRRMARIAQKKENEGSADRERFATWIAAYHQNLNDFNAPVKKPAAEQTDKMGDTSGNYFTTPEDGNVIRDDDRDMEDFEPYDFDGPDMDGGLDAVG